MVGPVSPTPPLRSQPLCHPLPALSGPSRDRAPWNWGRASWGRSEWGGGGPEQPRPGPTQAAVPGMGVLNFFFVGEYACGLNYLYAALISPKCFIGIRQIREREMDAPGGSGAGRGRWGSIREPGKLI